MALESDGYVASATLVDNGGNTSTLTINLTALTFVDAVAGAEDWLAALANVTDAVIKGYMVGERFKEGALSLPASGVQVENTAVLSCLIDETVDKYARIVIPAAKPGIFVGSSGKAANTVDPNDAAVQAYVNLFSAASGIASISDGEFLETAAADTVSGKRVHRGSRKG